MSRNTQIHRSKHVSLLGIESLEGRTLLALTTIDFEDVMMPDAFETYRMLGVSFNGAVGGKEVTASPVRHNFPAHSGEYLAYDVNYGGIASGMIVASPSEESDTSTWNRVGAYVSALPLDYVMMTAYDLFGNIIASVKSSGGDSSQPPPQDELLEIVAPNIDSVSFRTRGNIEGRNPLISRSLSIDDFFFDDGTPTAAPADIVMESATYNDLNNNPDSTIHFTYRAINAPGQFSVSLYQSANQTFDAADSFVATTQVLSSANSSGFGDIKLNYSLFIPQSKPYLLVVADPAGTVPEVSESNNVSWIPRLVTLPQLRAIMSELPLADAARYIDPLNRAMVEFQINTPKRAASFLSQLAVESKGLKKWEEGYSKQGQLFQLLGSDRAAHITVGDTEEERKRDYFNYWYHGKIGNGNYESNDGYNYRGRGPIQLTGYDNYRNVGMALDLDLLTNPNLVLDKVGHPEVGFRVSAYFFATKRLAQRNPDGTERAAWKGLRSRSSIPTSVLSGSMLGIADFVDDNNATLVFDVNDAITYGINGGFNERGSRLTFYKAFLRAYGLIGPGTT